MWYAKLSAVRLAARVRDQRLGAKVEILPVTAGGLGPQALFQSLEDWVYVSDSPSLATDRVLTLNETLELLDETGSAYGWVLTAEDTVGPTDAAALGLETYVSSTVTLQDAQDLLLGNGQFVQRDDSVLMSDAPALTMTLATGDSVSLSDALTWALGFALSLQDTVTLSDGPTVQMTLATGDAVSLSDALIKSQTLTLQGSTQGYVDLGYFASDYLDSAAGDVVLMTDSIA